MSFTIFYSSTLPEGFKMKGWIDLPIINQSVGFICLNFKFWFVSVKMGWGIK